MKKIVYIAMACLVSAACGGDGKSVEEKCVAVVDYAFATCSSDHSEKIAESKAACALIPDACKEEASAAYDCWLTATVVCNDPPGSGDLGYPQTTDCEDEEAAFNVCLEEIVSTSTSVCEPLDGPCVQGGSCTFGEICSNGSACEDYCFCRGDGTWECDLVRQYPCGCNEMDGFCMSNDGCTSCGCDVYWLCDASACGDVPDVSPSSD